MVDTTGEPDLVDTWRRAAEARLTGWDFSALDGRVHEEQPPWSYEVLAATALAGARDVLDMGTGGGEKLMELLRVSGHLPDHVVATEGWPPNLPVARANLAGHGIGVVAYDAETDRAMPFPAASFDVVLNRHEAYVAAQVHRVLRPGGVFVTQQVDGRDFEESTRIFGTPQEYLHVNLADLRDEAEAAGLVVESAQEWSGTTAFTDVAALVHYFALVPWQAPADFTVDGYLDILLALHREGPAVGRPVTFTSRRFHLVARRPPP